MGVAPGLWAGGMAGVAVADWVSQYMDENETLRAYDRALFGGAPDDLPDALHVVLGPVMLLGTLGAWVVGVIAIGALYRRAAPAVAVAVACWTSYLGAQVVKGIVARGRPADLLASFVARAQADGFGFASGHAAVVAGAAAALSPWLPRPWRILAWSLVALVAVARVYVGVHLPLDVVAGVGIGLICGTVATVGAGTPDV